jgi:hypothetical protein
MKCTPLGGLVVGIADTTLDKPDVLPEFKAENIC